MKRFMPCILCLMPLLAACNEKPLAVIELRCGDTDIMAEIYQNRLETIVGDKSIKMPQVVSASGARYLGEGVTLWNKGENWMMITDEDSDTEKMFDCIPLSSIGRG